VSAYRSDHLAVLPVHLLVNDNRCKNVLLVCYGNYNMVYVKDCIEA